MAWKYVMLQVGDRAMPIIFPEELVHAHVAGAMQQVIGAIKGPHQRFNEKQLETRLRDAEYREDGAPVRSAGFVEGLACAIAMGESESIGVKADEEDTQIINNHPYEKGMMTPLGNVTEALLLKKTIELLELRRSEISG